MKKLSASLVCLLLMGCLEAQPPHAVKDLKSTEFNIETLANNLGVPWGVAVLPDGSYLVTSTEGRLTHIKDNGTATVSGLPDDIYVEGQGGLLGIALSPDFAESGEVFLSYAQGKKEDNATAVYRARLREGSLEDGTTIFRVSPGKDTNAHFGGRMVFLPDGSLVLTLGDGFTYREAAQDKGSHLGKLVRIDRDGNALPDNPFVGEAGAKPEIYSWGHRNVQGLAFDNETGILWSHEHGPRGGDELNRIKPGANYGWPIATTGRDYNGARISPYESYSGTEPFVYHWTPSIAPSGLTIYRGDLFPEWNGDAFIGALAGQSVWRVDLEDGNAEGTERLFADLGHRIRDVQTDQDGALLVLASTPEGGKLLRVTPN